MSLISTGVIIRVNDADYGMHAICADNLIDLLIEDGYSALDNDIPAVIIGPLFADPQEWTCAHTGCLASN